MRRLKIDKSSVTGYLPAISLFVALMIIWQVVVTAFAIPSFFLPAPSRIIADLLNPSYQWFKNTSATVYEAVAGFFLAVVLGLGLAVLMTLSERLRVLIYPFVITAQVIPKLAFIPILFIWLGFTSDFPRIFTVFLVCFFPVVVDSLAGMVSVEPDMVELVRSYTPSKIDLLRKALFPTALPNIFAGLKVSITLAVIGALVAEFVSSNQGLGFLIISAQVQLDNTLAFAAATLLVAVGLLLYIALELLERLMVPWKAHGSISTRST